MVEQPIAPPVVVIQSTGDFYAPLAPLGQWETVEGYGSVWVPNGVAVGWRPYCNGHWENTDAGWFWVSDESWGWATYHYGRWDNDGINGWFWIPQTEWAPAWVSWRSGGDYVGWCPTPPRERFNRGVRIEVGIDIGPPSAFVFVEQRRFLERQRPATVIVNNTTIINKTTIINNTTVINKTVINAGPQVTVIERASGHPIQKVAIRDLRRNTETPVAAVHPELKTRRPTTPGTGRPTPVPPTAARPATPPPAPREADSGRPGTRTKTRSSRGKSSADAPRASEPNPDRQGTRKTPCAASHRTSDQIDEAETTREEAAGQKGRTEETRWATRRRIYWQVIIFNDSGVG